MTVDLAIVDEVVATIVVLAGAADIVVVGSTVVRVATAVFDAM